MSQPIDLSQFPDLPAEVVNAFAVMQFELSVKRAARQHEQAVVAEKDAFITELKELIEKLESQVQDYRHTKFGPKSEKLDPAQMELALEDLETAIAETQAQIAVVEDKIAASGPDPEKAVARKERKARALPRVERIIEPDSIACPCGCGNMVQIGEDLSVPEQYSSRSDGAARSNSGVLPGDRHDPPEIRVSQGPHGRRPGQGPGTPAGRELADRSPVGTDRRVEAFRTYAS